MLLSRSRVKYFPPRLETQCEGTRRERREDVSVNERKELNSKRDESGEKEEKGKAVRTKERKNRKR